MASKLKEKAAELLSAAFPDLEIHPNDIVCVSGYWKRLDVYRFQVFCHKKGHVDRLISVGCWETLTEFVRYASTVGCIIYDGEIWEGKGDGEEASNNR